MDAFEKDFGQFIDSLKYDEFEGILFNLVRDAYMAGYRKAGGTVPANQPVFRIIADFQTSRSEHRWIFITNPSIRL